MRRHLIEEGEDNPPHIQWRALFHHIQIWTQGVVHIRQGKAKQLGRVDGTM